MGGLQSTERSLSATASKGLSALPAVTGLCCAVNQRLTSVVREICTLRSVGAGGFGPWRPGAQVRKSLRLLDRGGGRFVSTVAAPFGWRGRNRRTVTPVSPAADLVFMVQPPAQPTRGVRVRQPIRFAHGAQLKIVGPAAQLAVETLHQFLGLEQTRRVGGLLVDVLDQTLPSFVVASSRLCAIPSSMTSLI